MDWRQIEAALADACHDDHIAIGNFNGDRCVVVQGRYGDDAGLNLTELAKRLERNGFGKSA
jgi:hypothetical protein